MSHLPSCFQNKTHVRFLVFHHVSGIYSLFSYHWLVYLKKTYRANKLPPSARATHSENFVPGAYISPQITVFLIREHSVVIRTPKVSGSVSVAPLWIRMYNIYTPRVFCIYRPRISTILHSTRRYTEYSAKVSYRVYYIVFFTQSECESSFSECVWLCNHLMHHSTYVWCLVW